MQIIIWAFCSMLVLMLIISFLPLGFTFKGKLLISIIGFVLALGGLAAVTTFPMWQTAMMIAVLIFFSAYFMDRRVGFVLYRDSLLQEDELEDELELPISHNQLLVAKENNLLYSVGKEIALPSYSKVGEQDIELKPSIDYLSEFESLLVVEDADVVKVDNDSIEGIVDIPTNNTEDTFSNNISDDELEPLDDSTFDFLFAPKEVAVGLKDDIEKTKE